MYVVVVETKEEQNDGLHCSSGVAYVISLFECRLPLETLHYNVYM